MKRTGIGRLSAALLAALLLLPFPALAAETDPPTEYTVTVDESIQNGSVTADPDHGPEGTEITLTVIPGDSFELLSLTVKDPENQEIRVENGKFSLPAGDVTVTAVFQALSPPPPPSPPRARRGRRSFCRPRRARAGDSRSGRSSPAA